MSESTNPKKRAEEIRIGVYTCYCGGNISDVVDCEHVSKVMGDMPNVVISRTDMSMCSDAGQALIEKDIAGKGIANPVATILSGAWMLEWLGQKNNDDFMIEAGNRIRTATSGALKSGSALTTDLGGTARTGDCVEAICKAL